MKYKTRILLKKSNSFSVFVENLMDEGSDVSKQQVSTVPSTSLELLSSGGKGVNKPPP